MSILLTHKQLVFDLVKPGEKILEKLTPEAANLWHLTSALQGEAGELFDAVKTHAIYNKPLDLENVLEELGDIEFYLEGIRQALQLERLQILQGNVAKLQKRYPTGAYSDEQAQLRADKNASSS